MTENPDLLFLSNSEGAAFTIQGSRKPNQIIFYLNHDQEMLRLAPEGFWVRGVQIEQDAQEAARVYEAFNAFMQGATFEREYRACLKNRDEEHLAAQAREDTLRKQLMRERTSNLELRNRLEGALRKLGRNP